MNKDNCGGLLYGMCYNDMTFHIWNTQGDLMHFREDQTAKRSFEVKIHIDKKLLKVASLPDYSLIFELNPDRIDSKGDYRFFLSMSNKGDMIRVKKMEIVRNFDDNF